MTKTASAILLACIMFIAGLTGCLSDDEPEPEPDLDGDGIPDTTDGDIDGDGMDNEWEAMYGLDPVDPTDNATDLDADGLTAREEHDLGTNPTEPDTDGDGLLDGHEVVIGMDPLDGEDLTKDLDADGMPNGWELDHGLNVSNPADALEDPDGDELETRYAFVEWLWVKVGSDMVPPDGKTPQDPVVVGCNLHEYTKGTDPHDNDTDDDAYGWGSGLTNDFLEIVVYQTDPLDNDTDGDGMTDGWEIFYNLEELDPSDAHLDFEDDGLDNLEEWQHDCHPYENDTDEDGMHDGWEVAYGFEPTDDGDADGDPDGDGATNVEEFERGTDPREHDG